MNTTASVIIVLILIVFAVVLAGWKSRNFDYQCGRCGARFHLPLSLILTSVHMMGKELVRSPHCGRWSWAGPVPKE